MSADDELCEVTELTRQFCAHCRGLPDLPVVEERRDPSGNVSYPVTAKYPGRCRECSASIVPGDDIVLVGGATICGVCAPWMN